MFRFYQVSPLNGEESRFQIPNWKLTASGAASTEAPLSFSDRAWRIVRSKLTVVHLVRAVGVAVLATAMYEAGYQAGLITYIEDPHNIEEKMVKKVLFSAGDANQRPLHHPHQIQVKRVGENLIFAAKQMFLEKARKLEAENKEIQLIIEANGEKIFSFDEKLDKDEIRRQTYDLEGKFYKNKRELARYQTTLSRLKGSWNYVVIDTPTVDAFVTPTCPRWIFVHKGLMEKLNPTDDELAFVIGHELSHFLFQHSEKKRDYDSNLKYFQLILLTFVEPVGFFALAYDYLLATTVQYLDASYSRECEEEADRLGIELAARACYDTKKSAKILEKLLAHETHVDGTGDIYNFLIFEGMSNFTSMITEIEKNEENDKREKKHASWSDNHPSFDDRIENITALSEQYSPEKYSACQSYLKKYIDSIALNFQV